MSAQAIDLDARSFVRDTIDDAWRKNRPLTILIIGMLLTLGIALVGLVVDPRIITGAPAWMKPAKFAISITIYAATLLWLLEFVTNRPRLVAAISWLTLIIFTGEMALVAMQAARGTTSHFNQATEFDAMVFRAMGGLIVTLWLLTFVVAALLFRRRFASPPLVWGIRLGVIAALIGMAVAFLMPQPTPVQIARMDAEGDSSIVGAHSVGVEDGGPGLPIVGWSTVGGDLRVPHFVGLHGMQVLPLLGWLLGSIAPGWLSARGRGQLAIVAGLFWIGLTILLIWQAIRGESLIAPDGPTLLAFAGLLGAAVLCGGAVLAWDARRARSSG